MPPEIFGIDHIHLYVTDRQEAAKWYQETLGFQPIKPTTSSASSYGPLTIIDRSGKVCLALFEQKDYEPLSAIAFSTDAENFLDWKLYLEEKNLLKRISDHKTAWSLYFLDPYGHTHEITTREVDRVRSKISV